MQAMGVYRLHIELLLTIEYEMRGYHGQQFKADGCRQELTRNAFLSIDGPDEIDDSAMTHVSFKSAWSIITLRAVVTGFVVAAAVVNSQRIHVLFIAT